ncbi:MULTISPECIES: hypothetical protein [unclassified Sphingomonas]|uniref:hypothetical protein n=1 Tax=unclassified Sphingomonas TaxID=196159 RepID=UPI00285B6472|nr:MULTISPECIES: hypothetical protein [unclassified Sphingomonas]MDR6114154.1 hypothetical protein [Sphingomonas sp. SORGH_AS_0789]MDR6148485.1 hypothetical protein [Sphingomonas sp. SORGH_AS_0742]
MKRVAQTLGVIACSITLLGSGSILEAKSTRLTQAEAKACSKGGGIVKRVGLAQNEACIRLFPDRGKQCTGPADCTGECRFSDDTRPLPPPNTVSRRQMEALLHQWDKMPPIGSKVVGKCQWSSEAFGCRATVVGGRLQERMCRD